MSQEVPRSYLVGKISLLENSSKKPVFFSTPPGAATFDPLSSILVSQSNIEQMAQGPIHPVWPSVRSGKTEGTVIMFVLVDRTGHVREATILGTNNRAMGEAANDQLTQLQWAPATSNGNPIQVHAIISLPFSTTLVPGTATAAQDDPVNVASGIVAGRALFQPRPIYPMAARSMYQEGLAFFASNDRQRRNHQKSQSNRRYLTTLC